MNNREENRLLGFLKSLKVVNNETLIENPFYMITQKREIRSDGCVISSDLTPEKERLDTCSA